MRSKVALAIFFCFVFISTSRAQNAIEGKAVVAHGFENSDLIRFGILRPYDIGQWLRLPLPHYPWWEPLDSGYIRVDRLMDSLYFTVSEDWVSASSKINFFGHQRAICAVGGLDSAFGPNLNVFGSVVMQRTYFPQPSVADQRTGHGPIPNFNSYGFAYNDLYLNTGASYHNNTYDSNDINPYVEYPPNKGFVDSWFRTHRYDTSATLTQDSLVYYGNEGRVILGYQDDRIASNLLTTPLGYPYPTRPGVNDTAKAFSLNLEFWLDDDSTHFIKDSALTTNSNNLPLVRLQVLYKRPNQSVLPFVPFADAAHPTKSGWYKCLDTVVTRLTYDSLPDDWRAEDSVFNGTTGQPAHSWRFKQLHTMINLSDNMIATAKRNISGEFGFPLGLTPISSPLHPDSLVKFGTSAGDSTNNLLELRVLSTYRTTVRIRDVTYQDTMVDRYLNRRRSGATSKSVEQNGHFGGNDFLLDSTLNTWSTILGTHTPRELMYNDIGLPVPGFTAMGYLESRSASHGIYVHLRPQDRGDVALAWRRARMSFDGQPPSAFENQANLYGADYLPLDYVHSGQNELLDNLFRRARRTQRRDNFCLSVEHVVQKYEEERGGLWTGQMG